MATRIPLPIVNPEYKDPASAASDEASADTAAAPAGDSKLRTRAQGGDILEEIEKEVKENPVMLYMKGSPQAPSCGFSARVVQILHHIGLHDYASSDVLLDPEKREGIKDYADWPTIPQLYIKGEFVGGCDIVTEMFQAGELQEMLGLA